MVAKTKLCLSGGTMIKAQELLVVMVLTGSVASANDLPSFPEVDSILDTRVHRFTLELGQLSESTACYQMANGLAIQVYSQCAELALRNFQIIFEARLQFAAAREKECDTYATDTSSYSFQVGTRLGYSVASNLLAIDGSISAIEERISLFDHPALVQAARDLLNAWKDIRDLILRRYPYLKDMKDLLRKE